MEGFAKVAETILNERLAFLGKSYYLSEAERTLLNRNWKRLVLKRNESFMDEHQKTLYWVEKGMLRIIGREKQGQECIYGFAGQYDFIDTNWFTNHSVLHWDLRPEEDSVVWQLENGVASVLEAKIDVWNKMMNRWYACYIKRMWWRSCCLREPNAVLRYKMMMEQEGKTLENVSLKHLASYLNITPQTLSRIRRGGY